MLPESLAILKTLAIRPSASIATSLQSMVEALEHDGYVANGPDGWSTTAKGYLSGNGRAWVRGTGRNRRRCEAWRKTQIVDFKSWSDRSRSKRGSCGA